MGTNKNVKTRSTGKYSKSKVGAIFFIESRLIIPREMYSKWYVVTHFSSLLHEGINDL